MAPSSHGAEDVQTCTPACSVLGPSGTTSPLGTSGHSHQEGAAHLGLIPGTFSVLEVPALLLKASLSTLLPLRDGAESEIV